MAYVRITNEWVLRAQSDARERDRIIKAIAPLVEHWVRRFKPRDEAHADDIRQECTMGVLRAIDTFRDMPSVRGGKVHFAGWATHWIRAFGSRYRWGIYGRQVKPLDREDTLRLDSERAELEGDTETWMDSALFATDATSFDDVEVTERQHLLEHVVKSLKEPNQTIWRLRFKEELTLEEIGARYGVTRERIRQILHNPNTGLVEVVSRRVRRMTEEHYGTPDARAEGLRVLSQLREGRRGPVVGSAPTVLPADPGEGAPQEEAQSSGEAGRRDDRRPDGADPKRARARRCKWDAVRFPDSPCPPTRFKKVDPPMG